MSSLDDATEYQIGNYRGMLEAIHLMSAPGTDGAVALAGIHRMTSESAINEVIRLSYRSGVSQ